MYFIKPIVYVHREEIQFSVYGIVCGVLASVLVSWNGIGTKYILEQLPEHHSWWLSYHVNCLASCMLVPFMLWFEYDVIVSVLVDNQTILWMTLSGVLAAVTNLVTVELISVTSPLTYNVVGTLKSSFQTILSVWRSSSAVTNQFVIANLSIVLGGCGYAFAASSASSSPIPIKNVHEPVKKCD